MAPAGELVKPDQIIGPDGEPAAAWDEPCPVCGSAWDAGPERGRWGRQHCWRCGYAPGQTAQPVLPGAPQQPDWAALVNDAVRTAMQSDRQAMVEAMTAALGREGLADLARQQQEQLGMAPAGQQTPSGYTPPQPGENLSGGPSSGTGTPADS